MKKFVQLVGVLIILVAGFFAYQFAVNQLRPPRAFLKVTSTPQAEVFLDGESLGKTPLQKKNLRVGSRNLVLKAEVKTFDAGGENKTKTLEFKHKIDLQSSAVTAVNYEFAPSKEFSSGEVLSLGNGSGIAIVTNPENSKVSLGSKDIGTSPLSQIVDSGVAKLNISKEGYITREVGVNVEIGFRLSAWVSLAKNPYPQTKKLETKGKYLLTDLSSNSLSLSSDYPKWVEAIWYFQDAQKAVPKKFDLLIDKDGKTYTLNTDYKKNKEINVGYLSDSPGKLTDKAQVAWDKTTKDTLTKASTKIQVLDTPNGFLNVRSGPGTNFSIIQKINSGQKFTLTGEEKDWYKILLDSSKTGLPNVQAGWVFSQYTKKL